MIERIVQLYMQVSERLLQFRIDRIGLQPGSVTDVDIAEPLIARVRAYAAESQTGSHEKAVPPGSSDMTVGHGGTNGAPNSGPNVSPHLEHKLSDLPSELALQFAKEPRVGTLLPPIGEQLRRRTFEYVNHALELAKDGKLESAETYAKLAECALKTASDYLPADEFLAFREQVLSRVRPPEDEPGRCPSDGQQT